MANPSEKPFSKMGDTDMLSDQGVENAPGKRHAAELRDSIAELEARRSELKALNLDLEVTRAQLEAATNRYREIFDKAPVGYALLDTSGQIQEANAELSAMLGIAPGGLVGSAFTDFLDPADWIRLTSAIESRATAKIGNGFVIEVHPPGKRSFYAKMECRSARIPSTDRSLNDLAEAVLVAVSDISAQKDIERAVIHAKEEWEQTFDAVHDPMALIDENHRVVRVNRALADRLELAPRECLGRKCFELVHGTEDPVNGCPHVEQFSMGQSHVQRESYEPKLGGYFITTVTPFCKPGSEKKWSVHVFHDISQRREVEEALRIREGRFRAITENTADITAVIKDGVFRYISPAIRQSIDIDAGDLVGSSPEDIIHPEDWPVHEKYFERAVRALGKTLTLSEARFRHRDGRWVPMEAKATYMPETPGVEGIVVVYRDITEKKQIAFQLQQSLKLESIGRLAGGVAHEFNNILGIIIGNAELALDDQPEGSTGKTFLKEILNAGIRARDVVRQLLKFSRRTPAERKPISVAPLITETLRLMRASIPTHIEIKSKIPVPHETISADPAQIRQVLVHLCTNAFQAMEKKGGRLNITVENVTLDETIISSRFPDLLPGRYVELTVRDNGHGIEPEVLSHIFDPYFSTREIGKSAGMGLAVAQGIIKSHDGAITVESQPGKGSVFQVYLPVVRARSAPEIAGEKMLPGRGEHILLVDDESALLRTLRLMLERLGYTVEPVSDPLEALNRFKRSPDRFDLLLTDMTMPEMDGQTLAGEILTIRPDLPVIICSGYTERIANDEIKAMKTVRTLSKPIDGGSLASALRNTLNGKHLPESN